ncbi:MAG: response regulator [Deltaproteobacteria bacterium]|nr:response regulator [Deltaproteobacteria bacterium]
MALEFGDRGYRVSQAGSLAAAQRLLGGGLQPRFAVVDLRIGPDNGLDVVDAIVSKAPGARAVILTGYGSLPTAVQAVKQGAVNYLAKPVTIQRLERALWTDEPDPEEVAVPDRRESLARHEREYIEYVLLQCEGNISKAARWLGIHRQSLQRKLRKFRPG